MAALTGIVAAGQTAAPVVAYADTGDVTDADGTVEDQDGTQNGETGQPGMVPENDAEQPTEPVEQPTEPVTQPDGQQDEHVTPPGEPVEQPTEPVAQPIEETQPPVTQPVPEGTGQPVTQPENPIVQPSEGTEQPTEPTVQPSEPAAQPTEPAIQPAAPAAQPSVDTPQQPVSTVVGTPRANTNYTPHHYTADLTTEAFIASIGEQARQIGQEHGLYASVMIAQAVLESGSGSSTLAQTPNNNLFGIKGSYEGKSVTLGTSEDDGSGNLYKTLSAFRVYDTTADSLEDYAELLDRPYYAGAHTDKAETPQEAAAFLQGRYATDTHYAEKIAGLIETYDLARYDEALDWEIVGTIEDEEAEDGVRDLTMDDYARLEAVATSRLGVDYVWGGESLEEGGFDCSGLVYSTYREALGIDLPRVACDQATVGEDVPVTEDDLQMGDLLFYRDETGYIHHVAMYLGDGYLIESPKPGGVVRIVALEDKVPDLARRVIETRSIEDADAETDDVRPATMAFKEPRKYRRADGKRNHVTGKVYIGDGKSFDAGLGGKDDKRTDADTVKKHGKKDSKKSGKKSGKKHGKKSVKKVGKD